MQIIDKVEINYFRSVYSISLKDCNHINIITGENDAGKSNILKALNLFFNNETEPHSEYDFIRDLNRSREVEAREAKGRMTIWILSNLTIFWDGNHFQQNFPLNERGQDTMSDPPIIFLPKFQPQLLEDF